MVTMTPSDFAINEIERPIAFNKRLESPTLRKIKLHYQRIRKFNEQQLEIELKIKQEIVKMKKGRRGFIPKRKTKKNLSKKLMDLGRNSSSDENSESLLKLDKKNMDMLTNTKVIKSLMREQKNEGWKTDILKHFSSSDIKINKVLKTTLNALN